MIKGYFMNQFLKYLSLLLVVGLTSLSAMTDKKSVSQIDDWEYNATAPLMDSSRRMYTQGNLKKSMAAPMTCATNIGLSVGGAKDTHNFKANLENGYLPKIDSITYEGQFYQHYFETGLEGECKELFCPSYASAKRLNPFTKEEEYFLTVGLNSGIKEGDFKRKRLNLVVVLDISGSMNSPFNSYYYDKVGKKITNDEKDKKTKMQIANESIVAMLSHLHDDDSVGVVLFDHNAYKAKALNRIKESNKKAIRNHILELKARGGTNWSAGYKEALKLFEGIESKDEVENRIIFLTDAMPNSGELDKNRLFGMAKEASEKGINTTFIGIGVDFNNNLVEAVSKTQGANYFSVHSSKAFAKLLDKEFDYMVTPLVYDLNLHLSSSLYSIEGVYGSPEADLATGDIMRVNTLFPSENNAEATKGGVILVKLHKGTQQGESKELYLEVSYKDVKGKVHHNRQKVSLKSKESYYDNSGIRKAILVADYVTVMKNWLIDARVGCNDKVNAIEKSPVELQKSCFVYPPKHPNYSQLKTWECQSCKLKVTAGYKKFLHLFRNIYLKEMESLNDETLHQEVNVLNLLINQKRSSHDNGGATDSWLYKK